MFTAATKTTTTTTTLSPEGYLRIFAFKLSNRIQPRRKKEREKRRRRGEDLERAKRLVNAT